MLSTLNDFHTSTRDFLSAGPLTFYHIVAAMGKQAKVNFKNTYFSEEGKPNNARNKMTKPGRKTVAKS